MKGSQRDERGNGYNVSESSLQWMEQLRVFILLLGFDLSLPVGREVYLPSFTLENGVNL